MPEIVPQEKKEFVAKETTLDNLNICLFCNNLENSIPQYCQKFIKQTIM